MQGPERLFADAPLLREAPFVVDAFGIFAECILAFVAAFAIDALLRDAFVVVEAFCLAAEPAAFTIAGNGKRAGLSGSALTADRFHGI